MAFENYNQFQLPGMYINGRYVTDLLKEELGNTNPFDPFDRRTWFTMPDGRVWVHKDHGIPKCMTFAALCNT